MYQLAWSCTKLCWYLIHHLRSVVAFHNSDSGSALFWWPLGLNLPRFVDSSAEETSQDKTQLLPGENLVELPTPQHDYCFLKLSNLT